MKFKEGRDYLKFEECCAGVEGDFVKVYDTSSILWMDKKEFHKLVKFVNKKFKEEREE